jgi:hypothetical protein
MSRTIALACIFAMGALAEVRFEKVKHQGWDALRVANGTVELVVTRSIGPRIMRYGFAGGQNFFWEDPAGLGKSGEKEWQMRGGHRVWVAPEDRVYTYPPDNSPIAVNVDGGVLTATQPVEKETGIQKELVIRMAAQGTDVEIVHRLYNKSVFPLEYAVWALSMMAPGGTGISGFPPRGTHQENLQPTNPLVMWAYTDFSDPRWTFTRKYFALRMDPRRSDPQKAGLFNRNTWAAYLLNNELFLKKAAADPARTYPDFGCSFETFTNNLFLELETVGPMTRVPAGGMVEHVERWSLHKGVSIPSITDAALDRVLGPLVKP